MILRRAMLATLFASLVCFSARAQAQTTVTFQQGVDGYNSLFDLFIGRHPDNGLASGDSNVAGSGVENFFLDGRFNESDDTQGLFRYDNIFGSGSGQIASNARILSATFELTTSDVEFAGSSGPFGVGQLLTSFDASTTYNGATAGFRFADGETKRALANGYYGPLNTNTAYTADVRKIVQSWANGEANLGFAVTAGTTNGWSVHTSGNADATLTPKLTVVFDTTPVPATTQTVITQSVGDANTGMFIVDNDGGAFADSDTTGWTNGAGDTFEVNYITPASSDLANGLGQEIFFRFDNLFAADGGLIPDDAIIESASLLLNTAGAFVTDDGVLEGGSRNFGTTSDYGIRQILSDWDGTGSPAGLNFGSIVSTQGGMIEDSQADFDITSILQNWQNGDDNFGLSLTNALGTNGWGIYNSQSGFAPELVINWRAVPEPSSAIALAGLGLFAIGRRRRTQA